MIRDQGSYSRAWTWGRLLKYSANALFVDRRDKRRTVVNNQNWDLIEISLKERGVFCNIDFGELDLKFRSQAVQKRDGIVAQVATWFRIHNNAMSHDAELLGRDQGVFLRYEFV
jgi:hypothetical protein